MAAKRRSAVNNAQISTVPQRRRKRRKAKASHRPAEISKPVADPPLVSQSSSLFTKLSRPSSEPSEPTLTSPSTGTTPQRCSSTKFQQPLYELARVQTSSTMAASQTLNGPGSSHNPIILTEDSPKSKCRAKRTVPAQHASESQHMQRDVRFDTRYPVSAQHLTSSNCNAAYRYNTIMPDPLFQLDPIIDQTSLLASLLQAYPRSPDQAGLREDIAMLASIQSQHLAGWLNLENGQAGKTAEPHRPRVDRSAKTLPGRATALRAKVDAEERKKRDDEVRSLLSASAELWQDGLGLSVADVFAETRA